MSDLDSLPEDNAPEKNDETFENDATFEEDASPVEDEDLESVSAESDDLDTDVPEEVSADGADNGSDEESDGDEEGDEDGEDDEEEDEEEVKPTFWQRLTSTSPYMVMLVLAFIVLAVGVGLVVNEMNSYDWKIDYIEEHLDGNSR